MGDSAITAIVAAASAFLLLLFGLIMAIAGDLVVLLIRSIGWVLIGIVVVVIPAAVLGALAWGAYWLWLRAAIAYQQLQIARREAAVLLCPDNEHGTLIRETTSAGAAWLQSAILPTPVVTVTAGGQIGYQAPNGHERAEYMKLAHMLRNNARAELPAPGDDTAAPSLPSLVSLQSLTPAYSIDRLVLGVAARNGAIETITMGMAEMVHVGIGGTSGAGKSAMLRSLCFQIARSGEADMAMCDLGGTTLAPFERASALLWPVATNEADILAVLNQVGAEMRRRQELFSRYTGVDSLRRYNRAAARNDGETLRPLVVAIDEATALMLSSRAIGTTLTPIVLQARKFGIWIVAASQSWLARIVESVFRDQLASRFQGKAMDGSQSRVLIGVSDAASIDAGTPGRCIAFLPNYGHIELQTPWIDADDVIAFNNGDGPQHVMPVMPEAPHQDDETRVRELHRAGWADSRIAEEVYGHRNMFYINKVRKIWYT